MLHLYLAISLAILGLFFTFCYSYFKSITPDIDNGGDNTNSINSDEHSLFSNLKLAIIGSKSLLYFSIIGSGLFFGFHIILNLMGIEFKDYSQTYAILYIVIYFVLLISLIFVAEGLGIKFSHYQNKNHKKIIELFAKVIYPIAYPYSLIVSKIGGHLEDEASREDISALVESAMEDGSIEEEEYRILKNVMKFSDVLVADVMTPRTVVFSLNSDRTIGEIINLPEIQMYSRFPIWEGNSLDDGIVGYIVTKDILNAALRKKTNSLLREYARDVQFIPENASLDDALDQFLKKRQHLMLVVDEYGGIDGLISMEDVMENILGVEIVDEADSVVDLRDLAKQRRDKRVNMRLTQSEAEE